MVSKLASYSKREINPATFNDALWKLTAKTGKGFNGFIGPPVTSCNNPECNANQLTIKALTNVSLFDFHGARPASKISLCCRKCDSVYNYSRFGRKFLLGERYYGYMRDFIEASDVVFISRDLYNLFTNLR